MTNNKITLAIESGIQGGSLSLLDGTEELDGWFGTKAVSRSEELLREISALLEKNNIKKAEIALIAVSNSAGSYTGVRIGLATALGVRRAVGCGITGVSVLESLARRATSEGVFMTAVTANGRDIYSQKFEKLSGGMIFRRAETEILAYKDFRRLLSADKPSALIVNEGLAEILNSDTALNPLEVQTNGTVTTEDGRSFIIDSGRNLAYLIGLKGREQSNASDNVKQVYIREFK